MSLERCLSAWSLPPGEARLRRQLAAAIPALEPVEPDALANENGEGRNRTGDTTVFSRVLYQLSYLARRAESSDDG